VKPEAVEKIAGFAATLDVEDPTAYIVIASNGAQFQGGGEVGKLDGVDRLDLVEYLFRCLRVTEEDVEEWRRLRAENEAMEQIISVLEEAFNSE